MKKQLQINDFLTFKYLSSLKSNPSHTKLAYIVATANETNNEYDRAIHIYDGQKSKQMTFLKKENNVEWLNDETLIFSTKRLPSEESLKDETTLYTLPITGGEAKPTYQLPVVVSNLEIINEDYFLVTANISLDHPNYFSYSKEKKEKLQIELKKQENYTEITEIPFWFNGTQYIDRHRQRLFLFSTKDNKLVPLTKSSLSVSNVVLHPNKKAAYFCGSSYKHKRERFNDLYHLDLGTLAVTKLPTFSRLSISAIIPLRSALYLLATDGKVLGMNQNPRLYQLTNTELIEVSTEVYYGNSVGSDVRLGGSAQLLIEEDSFMIITTHDGYARVDEFTPKNGFTVRFEDKEASVDGIAMLNNKLYGIGLFKMELQELYELEEYNTIVTKHNTTVDTKFISEPQKITFQSNGSEISGWVLLPKNFNELESVPAILDIHGGPKTVYGPVYYHEMQVWANQGYVVMYCNPHGSDGKGDDFSDIRGKYGTIDYEDIMTFVDTVLDKYPTVDKERIGVTGGSYGGFMTNWIIGHTNRFKAAATQRSISNWTSFYGVSDIGYYFAADQNDASIFTDHGQDKLWYHSPLKYAKNFKTPTLVIHSTDDYRCPVDQGYQLFTALKNQHIDAKMVIFKGENHDLSRSGRPQGRIKRLSEITNWMNKYLK